MEWVINLKHKTAVFILIVFTFLVYSDSLFYSFVWDDYLVIVNNDFIKSWKNIPLIFKREYLNFMLDVKSGTYNLGSGESSYRPIVTISYFID